MSLQDFKVLTFDVVGTLIDFEGGMLAYLRSAAPEARVTDEDFLAAYRYARADGMAGWYPDDLERCWHAIAPKLGLPDSDALAQACAIRWRVGRPSRILERPSRGRGRNLGRTPEGCRISEAASGHVRTIV
jgi:FMN phosphatase YigB (HAD superfamily)